MSSIDQYMPCVCGSGKKLKFCKCGANQHSAELEKILRLMDGDQDLSALDRINSQLAKLPNAAWLYPLKGELLLRMNEREPFIDVAHRFLKLKPDNPLALVYCSIATGMSDEPIEMQARHLLAGIAEASENAHPLMGYAIEVLCQRLLATGKASMMGFWGMLQQSWAAGKNVRPLIDSSEIHWFCKKPSKTISPPEDAPWLERMDEVDSLISAFRYEQAEKKLHSILRDYPNQASPLSYLLNAQTIQLDTQGAIATAKKLAQHEDLNAEDRAFFQVLFWELEDDSLRIGDFIQFGEIESDERLLEECASLPDLLEESDDDELKHLMAYLIEDEVPAKRVFKIQHKQTCGDVRQTDNVGTLSFFGRQTDKPPRVLLNIIDLPAFQPLRERVAAILNITRPLELSTQSNRHYNDFLGRGVLVSQGERRWETLEEAEVRLIEEFLNMPFAVLDGLTPLMASEKPELRHKLAALVLHLEGSPVILVRDHAIQKIYEKLNLERRLRPARIEEEGNLVLNDWLEALRLNCGELPLKARFQLFFTASAFGMPRLVLDLATNLLDDPEAMRDKTLESRVRSALIELVPEPLTRLQHSERLIEIRKELGMPVGRAVFNHTMLMSQAGRTEEVQAFMVKAMNEHPNDPELMAIVQNMMSRSAQLDGRREAGTMSQMEPEALSSQSASSLVLPGSGSSAAPSESKLWLPGT